MTALLTVDVVPPLVSPFNVKPKTAVDTLALPMLKVVPVAAAPERVVAPVNSRPKPLPLVTVSAVAPVAKVPSWSVLLTAFSVFTVAGAVNCPRVIVCVAPLSTTALP